MNIVVGVLAALAAYVWTSSFATPFYSGVVGGAILVAVGAYTAWAAMRDRSRSTMWPSVATLLVGIGLAAYPWFTAESNAYIYAESALGVIAGAVSIYEIVSAYRSAPMRGKPAA